MQVININGLRIVCIGGLSLLKFRLVNCGAILCIPQWNNRTNGIIIIKFLRLISGNVKGKNY
jgi:hypothetical protein